MSDIDLSKYPDRHPKSGKPCRLDKRNGQDVYIYPNKYGEDGAIISVATGKIAGQPKLSLERTFTTETALEALDAKKQRAIEAAQRGLMLGTGTDTIDAGWEIINAAQSRLAQASEQGNASTRAAEFVGKAAGIYGTDRSTDSDPAPGTVRLTATVSLHDLRRTLAARYDVVEGEVNDKPDA